MQIQKMPKKIEKKCFGFNIYACELFALNSIH